ncbi:MAG TPA: nuclear transport factor 2 family protein [Planctomycetaceae bacterium]|nr:nuclear transport factor 2 family protein [Planctomycetaceae bacterium]HQZ66036.1 nuclear transport factor 2 family protein [Planctomycetaceae bacterium]
MTRTMILTLLGLFGTAGLIQAQEPNSVPADTTKSTEVPAVAESPDIAAIRATSQTFISAFDQGDAKAIAALWTETGEYIDDAGRSFLGRNAIEEGYAAFFLESPGVKIRINIDSLRLLSDSAAIEDGSSALEMADSSIAAMGQYTAIHVKVDGKWKMSSVRDSSIEPPLAQRNLADLDWLIGTWIAEDRGNVNESDFRWVADQSFVERKYTVTHVDGSQTSGIQMIGWNPQGNHIQSWTFEPQGGHSVGIWSPTEDGWSVIVKGTTGDGVPSMSVTTLRRLDDNAYVWQSTQRSLGGVALPDTDEVVLKRQPVANGH